jgi:hypothetical protein
VAGAGSRTGRRRFGEVTEAEMIRASPTTTIGQVAPPIGNVMHDRVESVVRQRWPDVQFSRTAWMGRGRIVTYDDLGNVKEIDFPALSR